MRVDNKVRHNTFPSEGEILLSVAHADSTLLSMSTGKLISDLRDPLASHLDLGEPLTVLIDSQDHLVNLTSF